MGWWQRVGLAAFGTIVAGACANFSGDDPPPAPPPGADGSIAEGGGGSDAADAAPAKRCDPNKAFGEPVPYATLGSGVGNRESAWLVNGGVFTTEVAANGSEILYGPFVANDLPNTLGHVSVSEKGGTLSNPSWLTVAADGRSAYFVGTAKDGRIGIWRGVSQQGATPAFGDATLVIGKERVFAPTIRGNTLLYADQEPPRGYEMHLVTLDNAGKLVADVRLDALNTDDNDAAAVMTADGLRLYWGSDRPDDKASGSWDVWTATRANGDEAFGNPRRVAELATPGLEIPTWISDDDCTMLISTTRGRPNPPSGADIYVTRRLP